MNYPEILDYLYSRLPMFTRIGAPAIKKDLTNTIRLCEAINNPHTKFKSIHIAGTNGKGSVSHMLAAILQTAGYKTGLYTSPHLLDFRERIRIDGNMIPKDEVVAFVEAQQATIEAIEPSFFEVTVAMAFDYFANQEVDVAIIETGLGGRLDSTNIITPLLSVITNIGLDHVNILGNTLGEIAFEKAGIIKTGIPAVVSEKQPEVQEVFERKAAGCNTQISFGSDRWEIRETGGDGLLRSVKAVGRSAENPVELDLELDLTGSYQLKNVRGVLESVMQLRSAGFSISDEDIKKALKQVKQLTGFCGRWQIIGTKPLIICDTGHNEDGIKEVVSNINSTSFDKLHMVIGMVKDKDITKVLSLLPRNARYYFCEPALERAKGAEELAHEASGFGLKGNVYPSVKAAFEAAKELADPADLIFAGGSTFVVAEVLA